MEISSKFGRLTALRPLNQKQTLWECLCICGEICTARRHALLSGNKKSCGCLKKTVLGDSKRTHGAANSKKTGYANRAYGVWQAMKDRCTNVNRKDFYRYGGRGITVCEQWAKSFEAFILDMGYPPQGFTLDRIDNDKGYCKENCRWASRKDQVYNSTRIKHICIEGDTRTLKEWLLIKGISRDTYYRRLRKGMTEQDALIYGDAK